MKLQLISKKDRKRVRSFFSVVKENSRNYRFLKCYLNAMIKDGVDISYQDYDGNTLLHLAIKLNDIKLLKLFLEFGVNPHLANENRMEPIHQSIACNRIDMLELLVKHGADLESPMELEQTPLHLAVSLGQLEIVKYLVEKNVNINMVDENNLSALDYAIDERNHDIIKYFLNYGVDEEHKIEMLKIIEVK